MLDPRNNHDADIQKMRDRAMRAEIARYLRAEAKANLEETLRAAAKEAGFDFDKLKQPEPPKRTTGQMIADGVDTALMLPQLLIWLAIIAAIVYVSYVFFRGLFFGLP